ncbi:hypothetical protein BDQ17DRAFT_1335909 [Cyathus striatus]|nr:hypothetical protein BDQ17DRAFT_1335909 [Cyathus striatus]
MDTDVPIRPWIYGNIFSGMTYGAVLLVGIAYFRLVVIHVKGGKRLSTQQWVLSAYAVMALVSSTLQIAGNVRHVIQDLDLDVGCYNFHDGFHLKKDWIENISFIVTAWAVDIIMIWRFLIIYHDFKHIKWCIFAFTLLLQAASIDASQEAEL